MSLNISRSIVLSLAFGAGACGHAAGTEPHEMSAAEHEAAAQQEESQGAEHATQHDPNAAQSEERCTAGKSRICWTATTNPTEEHRKQAEEHRALAAQHRGASKALADAEARACAGIAEEDRDESPFDYKEDIRSVSELKGQIPNIGGKTKVERTVGATVVVNAVPGLTQEWLQRVVNCHVARNAAVGHDMKDMAYCPLVPRGAQATVRSTGDAFAVDIKADDKEGGAEIWRRAQQLSAK